jgi:hypothetical protein
LDEEATPHYHKVIKFYDDLSKQLASQGYLLDLVACALDKVGVTEMKVAIERDCSLVVLP